MGAAARAAAFTREPRKAGQVQTGRWAGRVCTANAAGSEQEAVWGGAGAGVQRQASCMPALRVAWLASGEVWRCQTCCGSRWCFFWDAGVVGPTSKQMKRGPGSAVAAEHCGGKRNKRLPWRITWGKGGGARDRGPARQWACAQAPRRPSRRIAWARRRWPHLWVRRRAFALNPPPLLEAAGAGGGR